MQRLIDIQTKEDWRDVTTMTDQELLSELAFLASLRNELKTTLNIGD